MKILITGVCGFTGRSLAEVLRERARGLRVFWIRISELLAQA